LKIGIPTENNRFLNTTSLIILDKDMQKIDSIEVQLSVRERMEASSFPKQHSISEAKGRIFIYSPVLLQEPIIRDTIYEFI